MALSTNQFVEGIDPTSTFGGYASVLLQLIRQATPGDSYGIVITAAEFPDVTGDNAWRKRCILQYILDPVNPVLYLYRTSGSPGWVNFFELLPDDIITTAMIQDHAVTIDKLGADGGTAGQLIRVNPGATGFEFIDLIDLFGPGSLTPDVINASSLASGQLGLIGAVGTTATTSFISADTVAGKFSDAVLPVGKIAPDGSLAAKAKFASCVTGDLKAVWRFFAPATDVDDGALSGIKLTDLTVNLSKISQSFSTIGQVPTWNGSAWVPATPTPPATFYSATGAVPTVAGVGGATSFTHGLGATPRIVDVLLRCISAESNYSVGDYIPLWRPYGTNGVTIFQITKNATTVHVQLSVAGSGPYIPDNTTGAQLATFTPSNWQLEVNCIK